MARVYKEHISRWPGYSTYDDTVAFTLVLATQTAAGIQGDVFEIGSYFGRSTAPLAMALMPDERLLISDIFDEGGYPDRPSPELLWEHISSVAPNLTPDRVDIVSGPSDALVLTPDRRFRFIHIDGGHRYDEAMGDLRRAAAHLMEGGIIAVDDYAHPWFPEVTSAIDRFVDERAELRVLADVNRFGDLGRKLYLGHR